MADTISKKSDLVQELLSDAEAIFKNITPATRCWGRRSFIRAVFALIEGGSYVLKNTVLDNRQFRPTLTELALVQERACSLDDKGKPTSKAAQLPTLANLRFAFDIFDRGYKCNHPLDVSGPGWQAVRRSLSVRHRLMHPKSASDLEVKDEEIADAVLAMRWFIANFFLIQKSAMIALRSETLELRQVLVSSGITDSKQLPTLITLDVEQIEARYRGDAR